MLIAIITGAAVVAIVVRAHTHSRRERRRAEYRRNAERRARARRYPR